MKRRMDDRQEKNGEKRLSLPERIRNLTALGVNRIDLGQEIRSPAFSPSSDSYVTMKGKHESCTPVPTARQLEVLSSIRCT